jgi:hypothetical protein
VDSVNGVIRVAAAWNPAVTTRIMATPAAMTATLVYEKGAGTMIGGTVTCRMMIATIAMRAILGGIMNDTRLKAESSIEGVHANRASHGGL